ncbi:MULTISPECIES: MFS transporter [Microbacterium]|uniref:MFS transporter n=1 Tax=Microbacterium TaxID=33882 RepID=UPI00070231B1|nr:MULTISPECIES: MFS transporter [Microbacterium]AZS47471.1 Enterobactin exporter EntS [Microbacterium oxydans]KQV04103.1 MFS transporter [Microbacterium sp. Root322]KQY76509.1 MFS transporter [Microbacterium sp. Root1433D1]
MSARRGHLIDLSPLRSSPAFARMWIGSTLAGIGGQLTIVTVMLHVFALTQNTFAVSMIAVAGLVPMILAGLYGGMLADAFDRRRVALIAATITFASTALLAALTWTGMETIWWLYVLSMINSAANSVGMATRTAIVPRLIPRDKLAAASALNGVAFGLTVMAGPALAGLLVALTGYGWTYTIDVVLMLSMFLGLWTLPSLRPEGAVVRPGLESLVDGWRFLRKAGNIRMQYIIDIIAMTFGQPLVLFPALGTVLLGGGALTTGILTAAVAVGTFASSLFSGRVVQYRWHGRGIARAVQAYGASILLFGLVLLIGAFSAPASETAPHVALIVAACVALALSGASDNVSSIYRNTMMQAAVPDAMRGRLQGLFIVVVAGGPRVGALYAGTLATLTTLWFPPLLGGVLVIALVAMLARRSRRFHDYDAENPEP